MKIVAFSTSPRKDANTETLLRHILEGAKQAGAETRLFRLNELSIKGCQACMYCRGHEGCAIKDDMQSLYAEIDSADAIVIGSPIYMWNLNAQAKTFIDRLYPYLKPDYTSKVNIPTLLAITQGQPAPDTFKTSLENAAGVLNFLGFKVKDVIVEGGCYAKDDLAKRDTAIQKAILTGQALVTHAQSWA